MADRIVKVLENGNLVTRGIGKKSDGPVIALDEDETLDVTFDWTGWLGSDTIASVTNEATSTTVSSESNTTTTSTFFISGSCGLVEHRITTAAGLTKELRLWVDAPGFALTDDYGFYGGCR
jgi:hypothetical protein